jgi:hypothetical protein
MPIVKTAILYLLVMATVTAAGQTKHRYVILPLHGVNGSRDLNLDLQMSEEFVDAVVQRLGKGGDPNVEVLLADDATVKPCRRPFDDCDLVNLAQLFPQARFPLRVDGKPSGPPNHGQVHDAICGSTDCWNTAIQQAAACIRVHHEVVHLGRRASNKNVCTRQTFDHGGAQ